MKPTNSKSEKIVLDENKYDNTTFWISYGIDLEKRRIMIDEDIDAVSVGWAIRALIKMIDADKETPIDIYINSYGGYCYDGLALYDFIRACSYTKIRTHITGKAMSCGFVIFLAGDERYSTPRSTVMAHSVSDGTWGKLYELKIDVKEAERLNNVMLEILVERTDKDLKWWKKEIEFKNCYYDKKKALALGIVTDEKFEVE